MNYLDYLHRYPGNMTNARFRTKSGFPLEAAGVLPSKPVQTASAATPAIALPSKPRHGFPGILAVVSNPPIGQSAATGKLLPTEPDLRERQTSRIADPDHARLVRRSRPSREKHSMLIFNALQTELVGSILLVSIAIAFSAIWWIEKGRGIPVKMGLFSQSAPDSSAKEVASKASLSIQASDTPVVEPRKNNNGAASVAHEAATAPPVAQTEPEAPNPIPAVSEQISTKAPQAPSETIRARASKQIDSKKFAKSDPIPLTNKRAVTTTKTVTTTKKERVDEINRIQTQAFSETKKDRLESSKIRVDKYTSSTRNAFNECQRNDNFIQREQCKWRVCSGKWGQNGCPSYKREDPASY